MPFAIDKTVRERTLKCKRDFVCCDIGGCPECDIEQEVSNDLVFVKPKQGSAYACSYLVPFASSYVCRCPVRSELWQKYRK
jgi:hypothetical protein